MRPCPRRLDGTSARRGRRPWSPSCVSSPATQERGRVHELRRRRWRRGGRARAASVMPPAHMPTALASSVPVMSQATSIASEHGGGVGVEVPVALLGGRVAPAEREVRDAGGDRALDEAAAGRQVGDVVLVDLRRDDHERSLVDPRRRLGAYWISSNTSVRCTTWPGVTAEVRADREGPGVDLRRHAAVVPQVVGDVAGAGDEALPAGLDGLGQRVGVGEQVVGRRHGFGEQGHREVGAGRGSWRRAPPRRSTPVGGVAAATR